MPNEVNFLKVCFSEVLANTARVSSLAARWMLRCLQRGCWLKDIFIVPQIPACENIDFCSRNRVSCSGVSDEQPRMLLTQHAGHGADREKIFPG